MKVVFVGGDLRQKYASDYLNENNIESLYIPYFSEAEFLGQSNVIVLPLPASADGVHLNISNKKLIDRATRIISELVGISYEEANYELFLTKLDQEARGIEKSTTIMTIERLKNKN